MRVAKTYRDYVVGDIFYDYFFGDTHFDDPNFDPAFYHKELKYACKKGAFLYLAGDMLSMLTFRDLKRYNNQHDPYDTSDIIHEAVDLAISYLKPYAKNIKVILCGNHETYITKQHHTDIVKMVITELNRIDGVDIQYLGYKGYISHHYNYLNGNTKLRKITNIDHGKGSGRGTTGIKAQMMTAIADIYIHAHTHAMSLLPSEQVSFLNSRDQLKSFGRIGIVLGAFVNPVFEESVLKNGKVRSYSPDYGEEKMKFLQSKGGVMLEHTIETKDNIKTRIIC